MYMDNADFIREEEFIYKKNFMIYFTIATLGSKITPADIFGAKNVMQTRSLLLVKYL